MSKKDVRINQKEELYQFACERQEKLMTESQYQQIMDIPKKLFVMAYLQGVMDIQPMRLI